jgi:hypothetical protein
VDDASLTKAAGDTRFGAARRFRALWIGLFLAGVLLRLLLWSGYGLGDDGNYYPSYRAIVDSGGIDPNYYFGFRFSLWIPIVFFMRIFGPETELGFMAFIFFSSCMNMILVYALARQEWERESSLLALFLVAVFPLDVACASLFATDIPLAMYCFSALWAFREALSGASNARRSAAWAASAGLMLFVAFLTKPWVLLVLPLFAGEIARRGRSSFRAAVLTGAVAGGLVAAYQGWQWAAFGDPLYAINLERSETSAPYSLNLMLMYPRMLFTPGDYGVWFAGFYPHLLVLAVAAHIRRKAADCLWFAYWLVMLIGLAALPVKYQFGVFFPLSPQIFRYLCLLSIPLVLALAGVLRATSLARRKLVLAALAIWAIFHALAAVKLSAPTRDAFGEQRRVQEWLAGVPDEKVWSDASFVGRFAFFGLQSGRIDRARRLEAESPAGWAIAYQAVDDGLVVTGGARLPWYGCLPCAANLGDFRPPSTWTLVKEFPARLTPYRWEPFRIWRVTSAERRARDAVSRAADTAARLARLNEANEIGDFSLAREIGRILIATHPDLGPACWGAGLGAYHTGHLDDAARWLERGVILEGGDRYLVQLGLTEWGRGDFDAAGSWVAAYRERHPGQGLPAPLEEIECGLAEGFTRYHEGRLRDALAIFDSIAKGSSGNAALIRRVRYFRALCLFRMFRVNEAVAQTEAYKRSYGEDADWVELRFRHAISVRRTDRATAHRIYGELKARFPETFWAREAAKRLTEAGL